MRRGTRPTSPAKSTSLTKREVPKDLVVAGGGVVADEVSDREGIEAGAPRGVEVEPTADARARAAAGARRPATGLVVGDGAAADLEGRSTIVIDAAAEAIAAEPASAADGLVPTERAVRDRGCRCGETCDPAADAGAPLGAGGPQAADRLVVGEGAVAHGQGYGTEKA